jgi:hypothetical protein
MEIKELKASAYDCITQIEFWQQRLQQINAQIKKLNVEGKENDNSKSN